MRFRERSETDNTGNPQESSDGDNVERPSKDDTPVESPVVQSTELYGLSSISATTTI